MIRRNASHTRVHLAVLLVCNTCALYVTDQSAIATVGRTCYHTCVHLAILRICDTRALDAADRGALMARYGLLFMDSVALYLYDTRCVITFCLYDMRCVVTYVRVGP
jgi:hypothetical protein